jgi:hypothetical protein
MSQILLILCDTRVTFDQLCTFFNNTLGFFLLYLLLNFVDLLHTLVDDIVCGVPPKQVTQRVICAITIILIVRNFYWGTD